MLHADAVCLKLFDHIFKTLAVARDHGVCVLDDGVRNAQPLGNGKCIRLAGRTDNQLIGGAQRLDVKLAGGVGDAVCLNGISLQLCIVRGGGDARAVAAQLLQDGHGKRRALNRVCARAKLVKKHQRVWRDAPEDVHNVDHMRRKSRERLLDALLVADVRQDVVKHAHRGVRRGGQLQTGLIHQRKQPRRLQSDRLAACVGAGDDQRVKFVAQPHINRHGGGAVKQRVHRAAQVERLLLGGQHGACLHLFGKACAGEGKRNLGNQMIVAVQRIRRLGAE